MALTILCITFFGLLVLGVPVAFSIGLSALATILYEGLPMAVIFQQMTSGMNVFSFLAIPFFIFAGELMLYGGIADKIVNFANAAVGHIRGGAGHVERRGLHVVRRRLGLAGGRRVGHGRGDDPDDEEAGLPRRLRGQRDDPRGAGGGADAHQPQPHHLHAGGRRQGVHRQTDPRRHRARAGAHAVQPGRGLRRGGQTRLPRRHLPRLVHRGAHLRGLAAGAVRRRADPRGHPVGRVHRDRVGRGGSALRAGAERGGLPLAEVGTVPEGRRQGGEGPPAWYCC